jgi:F-type H+-transporting ATPase subunit delta
MSDAYAIARPYSQAAFNEALESSTLEKWMSALEILSIAVSDEHLAAILTNPQIPQEPVTDLLIELSSQGDIAIKRFILLLAEYKRLFFIPVIFELCKALKMEHEHRLDAHVFSPFKLDASQLDRLSDALTKKFKHQVICHEHLDESLISGVVVRIGDKVIDHSIRDKINRFKAHLNLKEAICHQ